MSIRLIGLENHVPASPGNFTKGKTKIIKFYTQPDEQEEKAQKVNRYREQLDKQVQEMRRRKQEQKKREHEEDQRRQKQFYQNLEYAKKPQNQPTKNVRNFHLNNHQNVTPHAYRDYNNPEEFSRFDQSQDNFHFESRLALIGRKKIQLQVPVFQNRSDLIIEQDDLSSERRRRLMIDEMDRSLNGAHMAIERSKESLSFGEQLERLRWRLRGDESRISYQNNTDSELYNLPHKNYLYNSPFRYRHKRQAAWM